MRVETSKLNRRLGEVLDLVADGATVELTRYGRVVALITRAGEPEDRGEDPASAGGGGSEGPTAGTRSHPAAPETPQQRRDRILKGVNRGR